MKRLAKVVPVGLALIVLATTSAGAQAGRDGALLKAAEAGDAARIQELLASGADINTRDEHGRTPLMIAAVKGHAPAVTLLLDKGSDIAAKNKYGLSALQFAAGTGRAEVVGVLLERGANPRERDARTGDVPVISAAGSGSVDTVAALLARGADVNEKNRTGSTALMRATMNGRSEMVLFLLKNGADGTAKDEKGNKALGTLGAPRCISLDGAGALKEHGAYEPAEIQRALFNTVIGPASCTEVVKFLVESAPT